MSDHEFYNQDSESSSDESTKPFTLHKTLEPPTQYPLKHTWVLYDHTKSDSETYEASTRRICEFNTVVKFWQIFNNYPKPSTLFNNGIHRPVIHDSSGIIKDKEISSLSVFKKGILPKWEDPINKLGAEVSKRKFKTKNPLEEVDTNWIEILMACIGSMLDSGVTGIRVVDSSAPKKNEFNNSIDFKLLYRIELWFDSPSKRQIIEDQFKNLLGIDDVKMIYYKEHN